MQNCWKLIGIAGLIMASTVRADDTPLLNRELFFGNPQISGGQLSPDGKTISFMKAYDGIMNIWVKGFDEPFENARPITDSKRPSYGYVWTEDGKYILYIKDNDGDEKMKIWAVDPAQAADGKIPESRNLTPMDKVTAQIMHRSRNQPDLLWVGLNGRDEAWHDLYLLKVSTGELTLLYENNDRITGYEFDWDDRLRLVSRTEENGTTVLLRKDEDGLVPIYDTSVDEGFNVAGWDRENKNFYLETNKGELDLTTLYLMNPETKKLTLLESDPENRVDFGGLSIDQNTRQIISSSYTDDQTRYYWKNKVWEDNYNFLKSKFPGREVDFSSSTLDYSKFLISVTGDKYAAESWFFDATTRDLIHQYTPRPELKEVEQYLAPMLPVRYKSSDGLEIPGYLTIPAGAQPKNLPLVVLVHGGPKGPRDHWGFDAEAQFLANRGYAVLQPNFRASGGYGKAFLNAGDLQWGKLMQDDITWGVRYLIDQGIADKDRVCIMGGSYGGYATLAGLAFTPELYACGVDIVGPSNIFTLLDSVPPYWEPARAFLYAMTGDPRTEEGRERIRESSPLFSADKIIRPLLIIQGANDPRVKQAEADQIVIALRDRGHDVSYLLAGDEGHGFAKPVNRMAMYAEVERFLSEKLGGRYQSDMPDNVAQRLNELKVAIDSVTYTPASSLKVVPALPALTLPTLKAGEEDWEVKLTIQGQEIPMALKRTITEGDEHWLISDEISGLPVKMSSSATFDDALRPRSQSVEQGPTQIEVNYGDGQIELIAAGEKSQVEFEGALLASGPVQDLIVASLPLEDNLEWIVNVVSLEQQKTVVSRLQVAGREKLNDRDCVMIVLSEVENPNAKTTWWVDADSRTLIRSEQVLPQLSNATMVKTRK